MRTWHHQIVNKSRKRRQCDWCGEAIEIGQPYRSHRFAHEGGAECYGMTLETIRGGRQVNDRTCERCRFWHQEKPVDQHGQCRRNTPTWNSLGQCRPTTIADNSCGEWRDKSITPEQEQRAELVEGFAVAIVQGMHANCCSKKTEVGDIWSLAELLADARPKIGGEP